jgi:hypothetical protein
MLGENWCGKFCSLSHKYLDGTTGFLAVQSNRKPLIPPGFHPQDGHLNMVNDRPHSGPCHEPCCFREATRRGGARAPSGKGLKRPVARLLGVAFTVGFNKRPLVDPIADVCFGSEADLAGRRRQAVSHSWNGDAGHQRTQLQCALGIPIADGIHWLRRPPCLHTSKNRPHPLIDSSSGQLPGT